MNAFARVRVRWMIFGYMAAFAFMAYMQRSTLSVAAERIMPELQLSQIQIGWLMWAFVLTYSIFQMPSGVLGQVIGARRAYTALSLVSFIAIMMTPLAPWVLGGTALFVVLLLAQALLGLAQSMVFPMFAGVAEAWFPPRRWALVNGLQTAGMNIGAAMTPPLIVYLERGYGWQGALLWLGLPTLLLTIAWAWYGRDTPRQHPKVRAEELAELGEVAVEARPPLTRARLLRIAGNRHVLLLAFSYMCMNYAFYLLQNWCFLYLVQERGFSGLQSGIAAMLPPLGAAVGSISGGYLCDRLAQRYGPRLGYRLVPYIALPAAAALLLAAVNVDSAYVAVAALAFAFAAIELNEGPYWAATMQVARSDSAAATGLLNTGGNAGGLIGIPIVAYLSAQGEWNAAFETGAVLAIIAALTWIWVDASDVMNHGEERSAA